MSEFLTELWSVVVDGLYWICEFLFSWINIPAFPTSLSNSIDSFLNLIFDNCSLLGFFIRPATIKIVIPLLIILVNFEFIYKLIIWIAKKIPFIGIN